jgi:signal transduction histidine kinase
MVKTVRGRVWTYVGAIGAVGLATLGTVAIQPWMGASVSILFFPAVLIPAMYGGYGPALLATVLSTISLAYYFVPPHYSFLLGIDDAIRLLVFVAVAFATAWLSSARRRAEEAERRSVLLVGERTRELAIQEERLRVSRDLHDGVLQGLTGIRLELQDVAAACMSQSTVHERLLAAERALAIEQRELRRLIDGLRPVPVVPRLAGTLRVWLGDATSRLATEWKTPIAVEVTPPDLVVPEPLADAVRLMLHEAIVNALRHAHPSRVTVRVEAAGSDLQLSVVNDGRGFPFQGHFEHEALVEQNLGPVTLRDRVASLNGRMSITSSAHGSRVDLAVPLTVA